MESVNAKMTDREVGQELANDHGRCPDMCISRFNRVRLSISNPKHAGFTLQEMRLAAKVNAVIEGHRAKASEAS